jgi:hypothetical protein
LMISSGAVTIHALGIIGDYHPWAGNPCQYDELRESLWPALPTVGIDGHETSFRNGMERLAPHSPVVWPLPSFDIQIGG